MTTVTTWVGPAEQDAPLDSLVARLPEISEGYQEFAARLWTDGLIDPVLIEITRLRIAQLLDCPAEQRIRYVPAQRAGLTEDKIAAIPQYHTSDHFSPLERAALELAEQFVMDATSITDEGFAAVADHLAPPAVVALFNALGWFDGVIRSRIALGVGDAANGELTYVEPRSYGPA